MKASSHIGKYFIAYLLALALFGLWLLPYLPFRVAPACVWKAATGVECPGCGMTRALVALLHGHWGRAWGLHPWSFALVFACVWYLSLPLGRSVGLDLSLPRRHRVPCVLWLSAAVLLWWVGKLLTAHSPLI